MTKIHLSVNSEKNLKAPFLCGEVQIMYIFCLTLFTTTSELVHVQLVTSYNKHLTLSNMQIYLPRTKHCQLGPFICLPQLFYASEDCVFQRSFLSGLRQNFVVNGKGFKIN